MKQKEPGGDGLKEASGIGLILLMLIRLCSRSADVSDLFRYADDVVGVARYADDVVSVASYADDLARYADDVVGVARYADDVAGMANYGDEAAGIASYGDEVAGIVNYGDEVIDYSGMGDDLFDTGRPFQSSDDLSESVGRSSHSSGSKGILNRTIIESFNNYDDIKRNLDFMDEYVTNLYRVDDWVPLEESEYIKRMALNENVQRISGSNDYKIVSIIPTEEKAFQNVFNADYSFTSQRQMEKYKNLFDSLDNSIVLSSDDYGEDFLLTLVKENSGTDPLIIVGHSDSINAERLIMLPNGESVPVRAIHSTCANANVRCLVLTCHSDDFGLTGEISLGDAYYMTERGLDALSLVKNRSRIVPGNVTNALENGLLTESDLLVAVMRSERIVRKTKKMTIIGTVSSGGVGGTYLVISHLNQD
ncbi:MAG: hypothetical protein DWQ04_26400 [Chloroflexi bacterium]|nr:MAG: hypothetical protein DWQ04_26400 [Chloroflexota bacterium]